MGNELSNEHSRGKSSITFGRRGALGLNKAELDKRCQPSGLYPSCQWEDKAIRKLIGDGRLAARLKGTDTRQTLSDRECPICFLQYSQINTTQCCKANICTECFLQVRPQKSQAVNCTCPFCNHPKLFVTIAKPMPTSQIALRQHQEQAQIEQRIRQQQRDRAVSMSSDHGAGVGGGGGASDVAAGATGQDATATRTRAMSDPSVDLAREAMNDSLVLDNLSMQDDVPNGAMNEEEYGEMIRHHSMTEQDRRVLEEEMRAQHVHPLALQMEMEAEERRLQNDLEYYRSHSTRDVMSRSAGRRYPGGGADFHPPFFPASGAVMVGLPGSHIPTSSTRRNMTRSGSERFPNGRGPMIGSSSGLPRRNWNEIVDSFERGGNGEVNSLDDLVVLEAAMILSMEEEARRRAEEQEQSNSEEGGSGGSSSSSSEGDATPNTNGPSTSAREEAAAEFDANQHARDGFPLVHQYLMNRSNNNNGFQASFSNNINNSMADLGNASFRGRYRYGTRGLSEEEQMAMAIALSMQDSTTGMKVGEDDKDNDAGDNDEKGDPSKATGVASLPPPNEDEEDDDDDDIPSITNVIRSRSAELQREPSLVVGELQQVQETATTKMEDEDEEDNDDVAEPTQTEEEDGGEEVAAPIIRQPDRAISLESSCIGDDSMADAMMTAAATVPRVDDTAAIDEESDNDEAEAQAIETLSEDDGGILSPVSSLVDRTPSKVIAEQVSSSADTVDKQQNPTVDEPEEDDDEDRKIPARPLAGSSED